jgi:protein-S-isoprenylcysteine O-methyltransferase Ste14
MKLSKDAHAEVLVKAEYIFMFFILFGFLINMFWPLGSIPTFVRSALGIIFVGTSVNIIRLSWDLFEKAKTSTNPLKPTKLLITTGPHKYSRNPQYFSRILMQVGIGFVFGNIWIVILVIPAFVAVWYSVIIPEERYLEQKFGEKYLQYKASTRCWL